MARSRRSFTPKFKIEMVCWFKNRKSESSIVSENVLIPSALDKWIKNHQNSGSFNNIYILTVDEKELKKLRKVNQQ